MNSKSATTGLNRIGQTEINELWMTFFRDLDTNVFGVDDRGQKSKPRAFEPTYEMETVSSVLICHSRESGNPQGVFVFKMDARFRGHDRLDTKIVIV